MQIEGIVKRVNNEFIISEDIIEEVFRSQFKFMIEHFRQRNSKAINCIYLGKFLKNKSYDEFGNKIRRDIRGMEKPSI